MCSTICFSLQLFRFQNHVVADLKREDLRWIFGEQRTFHLIHPPPEENLKIPKNRMCGQCHHNEREREREREREGGVGVWIKVNKITSI